MVNTQTGGVTDDDSQSEATTRLRKKVDSILESFLYLSYSMKLSYLPDTNYHAEVMAPKSNAHSTITYCDMSCESVQERLD